LQPKDQALVSKIWESARQVPLIKSTTNNNATQSTPSSTPAVSISPSPTQPSANPFLASTADSLEYVAPDAPTLRSSLEGRVQNYIGLGMV
jgi:hypothetical protein